MANDREVIEMRLNEGDDGKLHYSQADPPRNKNHFSGWILKIIGIALGVAFFLFLLVFFVYVIIPLVLILILFSILRRFFKK